RSIVSPVMFPPGRAKLATCPMPTGSAWVANTMGIVLVAWRAGSTMVEDVAKMTSTFMVIAALHVTELSHTLWKSTEKSLGCRLRSTNQTDDQGTFEKRFRERLPRS